MSPHVARESELRARYVAGDPQAIATVYDAHAPEVYALARSLTGKARAERLVSAAFVGLLSQADAGPPLRAQLLRSVLSGARGVRA